MGDHRELEQQRIALWDLAEQLGILIPRIDNPDKVKLAKEYQNSFFSYAARANYESDKPYPDIRKKVRGDKFSCAVCGLWRLVLHEKFGVGLSMDSKIGLSWLLQDITTEKLETYLAFELIRHNEDTPNEEM